jgi:hypothetical protein
LFEGKRVLALSVSASPFVFIWDQDVVGAIAHGIETNASGRFNLAGDGALTMRDIAMIIGRPLITISERLLRAGIEAAWKLQASELAPAEVGAFLYMPIVDTTRLREEWGFTCASSSREALTDMARAAHGRITLGKKTLRLPWRVPPGSDPKLGRVSAFLLRRTYADEVDRILHDLAAVQDQNADAGDRHQREAHKQLLSDLADHAQLLASIGERYGYSRQIVARAEAAAAAAHNGRNA